jgi:hypothetical protein
LLHYDGFSDIIVVAVGYPDAVDFGGIMAMDRLRTRDICIENQPQPFLDFLTGTLVPYIDSSYSTDPNDRAIMGHSCGADFVLYAFFHAQGTFQRFVAASAGTGGINSDESVCIRCELEKNPDVSGILFMSAGENDMAAPQYVADAVSSFQELSETNFKLIVSTEMFEKTDHVSVIPFALSRGLMSIYCRVGYLPSCRPISVQFAHSVDDADYPPGKFFTTRDGLLLLRGDPARDGENRGNCQNTETTVMQTAEDMHGRVWVQLECGDITGWIEKRQLEE